jgi:hypothetical protein
MGYVILCATAPLIAPAINFPHPVGLVIPSGVTSFLTCSYTAKLSPTYGATPRTVGTRPRYKAGIPPSVR